ncbi:hypothetical protein K1T71_005658 [Dendrolimus kikuchii]|uniref:Uncharacterized protein n=1 Tax=Dendrolimus kikuchii TaxID=765133 RepID=A0ACC1D4N4_9NEOP|nr:hypothetical protein K1T71_005658 [Dendrolimus kikuchii]
MTTSAGLTSELIDQISKSCIDLFNKLPKTGKPVDKEWTVLSCIVQYDKLCDKIQVVSLGTGSKCIGATKMCPKGGILNDSHAEIFARRGFLLYLYDNIRKNIKNKPSIFRLCEGVFKLKENIEFVFYSSQLPCGDASIIAKNGHEEHYGDILEHNFSSDVCSGIPCKKMKMEEDIHRTGAKCLPQSEQDPQESGINYHLLGQVRTKPGRGDRTLSVSCSDKMSKWVHLGIQGSLLSLLCDPVYLKYFVFGAQVPYSKETLERALLRHSTCYTLSVIPKFYQSSLSFGNIRHEHNTRPAPGSIFWVNTEHKMHEVAVQGKKLGITKKGANSLNSSLGISKYNLYKTFFDILNLDDNIRERIVGNDDTVNISYNNMKGKSKKYLENWLLVKEKVFKTWTVKPDIWNFYVNAA